MEITKLKHIHFTGIKGVGMTALALCMRDLGIKVTGSDISEEFVTDEILHKNNVAWKDGFSVGNLQPLPDLVVTTGAHGGLMNPEVVAARKKKIPVLTFAELLAEVSKSKDLIAVCGVGGKTTTSSIISVILDTAELQPSFAVGVGNIYPLGTPGKYDKNGSHFICEADEYVVSPGINNSPKFMLLNPKILIVTNIEYDHPDIYKNLEETKNIFRDLFLKIPKDGLLVACIDNANVASVIKDINVHTVTYGFSEHADFQIKNLRNNNQKVNFDIYIKKDKSEIKNVVVNIPGKYNALNLLAAFVVGWRLNISYDLIKRGLERYLGCRRRFEEMPHFNGAVFVDDYAHHPKEIQAVIKAARDWYPKKRIIAIFQPHTYSRTKALFDEFSESFKSADIVGFMDIYASAREGKDETVTSHMLVKTTGIYNSKAFYLGDSKKTLEWIKKNVGPEDVVLTMGAGDIFHLYEKLKN
ncbi:UDP-N-acetylmuramate--L-alanine ligase [Candidatus Woesebacteria bacterium RIFCSPLOWO2_01_FULL_39_23]|uniref:UDP-N-acetylmuramate--L-alanine ligase n=1 Tax=Candidatus Woesebacteria bacterium RIFCSPHIGHO2_01_FULL_40_22 TaxID=1802499 RepID=A0A1F7YJR9_9BACT|nr:MAG: UDP-N-acetylmuramate--L-alanine ligase [Candidatus Woesebacteria bacterium RBG_16_40_11]OGM27517.1 MAG: UDP-N-acetylmuramate--L-alanine ligase [Candidatus Woesebacteria bacterium RIFCSPHIGHO2_01_FULL_40_22]OGM36109.1 MAG: UDP-N-acetylmuramate--L-alanine ligase [Candidatus Woesebacteria bacterium RIFCSPHIGHO2_12_FULL_38_9]OGM62691.1 MAG: UDP-N-acetylmuramate--L-alanine ligase [Candidatus Woesebacteria bacterium RIFCSPLOWO2_01_FULL_39_23]